MNSIEQLVATLFTAEESQNSSTKLFCFFNTDNGEITGVSSSDNPQGENQSLEIPYEQGIKFLEGSENFSAWHVVVGEHGLILKKKEFKIEVGNRVDLITMMHITDELNAELEYPEVLIEKFEGQGLLKIHYNGEQIQNWTNPLKIFVTKQDDPTHLLCSLKIDVNILSHLQYINKLEGWPNPLVVKFDEDYLSVFYNRYTHQIKQKTYENSDN